MPDEVMMPDGKPFEFWDDETEYTKVYHVACGHSDASDDNPGTEEKPLLTISRAAELLQPGEKAVIHHGVYREEVHPARGGQGPDRMIAYEAAPGEDVLIKGSRVWEGPFEESHLQKGPHGHGTGMMAGDLPPEFFHGFNPFLASNMRGKFLTMAEEWVKPRTDVIMGRQTMMLYDGEPLKQLSNYHKLMGDVSGFWVERSGLRVHFKLPGGADPAEHTIEVTTQQQAFVPRKRRLGYIRVSGLQLEHSGDPISPPQRALLSTNYGNHWIIEDCRVRHAHALGIDIGTGFGPGRPEPHEDDGGHIVRRNHISWCGQCGLAGERGVDNSLIEDNVIEDVGDLDIEWEEESGCLKLHGCDRVLIRRNVFRHTRFASGVWMDYICTNNRVTNNVFADLRTMLGATYFEGCRQTSWVDNNLYWKIENGDHREVQPPWVEHGGLAVDCDSGEGMVVVHNLIVGGHGRYGISLHLQQHERGFGGTKGICRDHTVQNNVLSDCRKMVYFGRMDENLSDHNVFPTRMPEKPFTVRFPEPDTEMNLARWRDEYGQDRRSTQLDVEADFDPDTCVLKMKASGEPQDPAGIDGFEFGAGAGMGILSKDEWKKAAAGDGIEIVLPRRRSTASRSSQDAEH